MKKIAILENEKLSLWNIPEAIEDIEEYIIDNSLALTTENYQWSILSEPTGDRLQTLFDNNSCIYCGKVVFNDSELHYRCPVCHKGMCQDCYDLDTPLDEQFNPAEDDELNIDIDNAENVCFDCVEKLKDK